MSDRIDPARDDRDPATGPDDSTRAERLQEERLHDERLQEERLREERLQEERLQEERLRAEDRTDAAPAEGGAHRDPAAPPPSGLSAREEVAAREKEEFGGMRFGLAFFGWLAATGMAVILTALVAGAGAALGLGAGVDAGDAVDSSSEAGTIGIAGAIAVLVILLIAYYCGGYVAGRMARFSGAKQGVAVWLWAIVTAIVAAVVGAVAGAQWNILANIDSFPRLPFGEGELTTFGIITAILTIVVSLVGAVLGGLAGMRFHRRVDRVGLGR
ncbi:hypothetical protein [Homoserinibacter sp. YIM 151385]|uniref:hypothetical protein n=1 Tax=Homoserinibacter sp. YIM 151385 TaxID=2985506 RepID=UPI0022F1185E|nr:hypothetical protein [Homoserinibacter sp. YIM 151385]WBU37492.1 hypothetical protein OF852_11285 [Homoserinibacter sp. YIM 151385]